MLNKSYSYLVPLLNEHCKIDSDYVILIKDTYAWHYDYPDEDMFVVSYEKSETPLFTDYVQNFTSNELFKEFSETDDDINLVFYFPNEFKREYNLYKQGRFSAFSEKAKVIILNYILDIHNIRDADRVRRVLYKDEELRKELEYKLALKIDSSLELSSKPNRVNETFIFINQNNESKRTNSSSSGDTNWK